MGAIKFKIGEPKNVTLAFDEPKTGTNDYGMWYLYGIKTDINDDEDGFFATRTLHTMIQTLEAKEGDELTIEKCEDGDITFYKVNGLSMSDMNSGGSFEKVEAAKPNPPKVSLEGDLEFSIGQLTADFTKLKSEFQKLEAIVQEIDTKLKNNSSVKTEAVFDDNDIPF